MSLKNVSYFITIVMLVAACAKDPVDPIVSKKYGDELILGERFLNPYDIGNMNIALKALGEPEVQPNKKYVRFQIEKEEEMSVLNASKILLFDHPLDFEVKENGPFYLGSDDIEGRYFYSVMDVDHKLPETIKVEVLNELYLPVTRNDALERQAFEQIGLVYKESNLKNGVKGSISFEEITDGNLVGLKDLKVIAREWFRFETVKTDVAGNFQLNKNYSSSVEIYIQFDNDLLEFRTLTEDNLFLVLLPNFYILGDYNSSSPINIVLNEANFNNSNLLMTASAYSAYYDFIQFTDLNNLTLPDTKLLVWMADSDGLFTGGSAAPMLRSLASDDLKNIRTLLKELFNLPDFLANPISNMVKNDLPDLFLQYNTKFPTQKESTWYHEYTHASHYAQVGKDIWLPYIQHIVKFGGYGWLGEPTSGIIALSEAWAEDASQWCHEWKFGYADENLEDLGPNDLDWIPYGIYYDLFDENNADNENDNVSGFSISELHSHLLPQITSPELLKEGLLSTINDAELTDAINVLFEEYGY